MFLAPPFSPGDIYLVVNARAPWYNTLMTREEKATKLGLKQTRIHMGMFDFAVQFIVGDYEKSIDFTSWILEDDITEQKDFEARGKCFYRPGYLPVVWVPRRPRFSREKASLSHECLHATFHLFRWASIPIDDSTEETMCHAMAHLINEFYEGIK